MASVVDVAAYVLGIAGSITTVKLQKLVFYCQAYHLVRHHSPLFQDDIEAWANGPVIPSLFGKHRGRFIVCEEDLPDRGGDLALGDDEHASIEKVVGILGGYSGEQLIKLTHSEDPWNDARRGLRPGVRFTQYANRLGDPMMFIP